jgi:hypothetical protein
MRRSCGRIAPGEIIDGGAVMIRPIREGPVRWSFAFYIRTHSFIRTFRSAFAGASGRLLLFREKNVRLGKLQKLWTIRATETEKAIHFTTRGKCTVIQKQQCIEHKNCTLPVRTQVPAMSHENTHPPPSEKKE